MHVRACIAALLFAAALPAAPAQQTGATSRTTRGYAADEAQRPTERSTRSQTQTSRTRRPSPDDDWNTR